MNDTTAKDDWAGKEDGEEDSLIIRPTLAFESITFSDGQTIDLEDDEIVVFVGPNNAGKSAALRELDSWIKKSLKQNVIIDAKIKRVGSSNDLKLFLMKHSQVTRASDGYFIYAGIGYSIHETNLRYFDSETDRHPVAPFFTARLATEIRITASDPTGAIALYEEPPSHPIHLLLMDDKLSAKISRYFIRAFGRDLIVFRAGGKQFPLLVGVKPAKKDNEDELSRSFVERLRSEAKPLKEKGDGMRSFATVLLYVLAADNQSIQFLDEPEAFLHPPQARLLGEYIATERRSRSQLFIATHCTDILDGLMAGGTEKIRIIRIQREGDINRIKELSREKTSSLFKDTLTRYSGVFRGIFYEHVIITESDSDCLFYNSILNCRSITGDQQPDVLFIHASGKHRMGSLAETLRSLDVPVSVIADLDLLNDEGTLKSLFEKLGGCWQDIENHWRSVKSSVEGIRSPLTSEQVKGLIENELAEIGGLAAFPKQAERNIKLIFKSLSPWDVVKRAGRSGISAGQATKHFDKMSEKCSSYGLWLVPEGELEGFCRSIDAGHGPAFVEKVLEERDLELDQELSQAREFVKKIWDAARPDRVKAVGS